MENDDEKIPEVVGEIVEPDDDQDEENDDDDDDGNVFGPLYLGPPFAFEGGINLLKEHGGKPGSTSICQCENCGQLFKIDLLDGAVKSCPKCRTAYTHCLIVCRADDDTIFEEAIDHIVITNRGLQEMAEGPGEEIPNEPEQPEVSEPEK